MGPSTLLSTVQVLWAPNSIRRCFFQGLFVLMKKSHRVQSPSDVRPYGKLQGTLCCDDAGGTRLWVRRSKDWRLRMLLRCGYKASLFNLAWCSSLPLTESLSSIKFIPQFLFLWANSLFRFLEDRMVRYLYFFQWNFFSWKLVGNDNYILQISPRDVMD